ncbi:MAG TPA: glycosyltransferase [Acidimicrobiales bacterium]|nr:glycosyltransferase [Acidimicrobiales bacterium]
MSIAYVSRRTTADGHDDVGAHVAAALAAMAAAPGGEPVFLVTSTPAHPPAGVEVVPVPELDPRIRYFSELHRYADRVYHALDALTRRTPLDTVVFSHDRAEGFTTIRAKRTLGRFAGTRLVVAVQTPAALVREAVGWGPTDLAEQIRLYAEDYAIAHADVVVSPTAALDRYVRQRFDRPTVRVDPPLADEPTPPGAAPGPGNRPELVFLGALTPAKGADRFVAVAERIAARDPEFRFRLHGPDTPTDPFGGSYRAHLEARLPAAVAGRIGFETALPGPELDRVVGPGTLCLFPARCDHAPYELLRALHRGAAVLVGRHDGVAELVDDGITGRVVDVTDPDAVADAVLALHGDRAERRRLGEGARRAWRERGAPAAYRARMRDLARAGPPATATATATAIAKARRDRSVSVVIPVFAQPRYLRETVASARASQHDDLEIVVVDAGSTDPRVDQVLATLDADVVVVRRATNGGVAAARNSGIAAASGRFVMPLDGDDLVDPTYVPRALDALQRHPGLAYVGCYSQNFGLLDTTYVPVGYVPDLMLFLHTDGRCTKLFDRTAIEAVGGYDEDLPAFEDWDLYLRLAKHGFTGDVLPEALFHYRRHRESTVFTWSNDSRIELLQHLVRKHRDLLADHYETVVLHLLHLWKTYYEVSESVLLQTQERTAAADPEPGPRNSS